jgi:hypothetical protein
MIQCMVDCTYDDYCEIWRWCRDNLDETLGHNDDSDGQNIKFDYLDWGTGMYVYIDFLKDKDASVFLLRYGDKYKIHTSVKAR